MTLPGFTMMDIQDPKKKLEKLRERLEHIDQQIKELDDRKWIILSEMSDLTDVVDVEARYEIIIKMSLRGYFSKDEALLMANSMFDGYELETAKFRIASCEVVPE